MTPREIAERYVELLNSGRFNEVGELWADDGVLFNGFGQVLEGKPAVKAFYAAFRDVNFPRVQIVSFMEDSAANVCAVELETRIIHDDGGSLKTDPGPFSPASVDLFKVNADGKVQKMIAYIAPPNKWLTH